MSDIYKPKTIEEAIDILQNYFEADLPSKFTIFREDHFTSEQEFMDYLKGHFDILREQIKELSNED
jgi:hypothetical protein